MKLINSQKFGNLLLKACILSGTKSHIFSFQITGNGSHISANACNVAFPVLESQKIASISSISSQNLQIRKGTFTSETVILNAPKFQHLSTGF